MRTAAIAFDLDGTLVDSAPGICFALNAALATAGLPPFDPATVRGWIGDGPDATIRRALDASRRHDLDPQRLRRLFDATTLDDARAHGPAYPGIAALLARLAGRYPLLVVTNKPTPLARAVLGAAGLLDWLSAVHGADLPAQRKPAPLLLQQAAGRLGLPVKSLLMIGDGPADIAAAAAAGCRAVWASWGYGAQPADAVAPRIDTPSELLAYLNQDPQGDSPCPPEAVPRSRSSSSRNDAATPKPLAT